MAAKVIFDISMSLDGYVTGPDPDLQHGLGVGGEPIHHWAIERRTPEDEAVLDRGVAATGAVVMGRNLFDIVDGPEGWSEEMGYGADRQRGPLPFFVVTHEPPAEVRLQLPFTFVTEGVERAVAQAQEVVGDQEGKAVVIMGGADVGTQAIAAGLVDEVVIHLAPVLMGGGTRLFEGLDTGPVQLEKTGVVDTPAATHLTYRVPKA